MVTQKKSFVTGLVLAAVGLALWLTTEDVDTPIVTLTKVGVVLMALGALEVAVSVVALARSREGHNSITDASRR